MRLLVQSFWLNIIGLTRVVGSIWSSLSEINKPASKVLQSKAKRALRQRYQAGCVEIQIKGCEAARRS